MKLLRKFLVLFIFLHSFYSEDILFSNSKKSAIKFNNKTYYSLNEEKSHSEPITKPVHSTGRFKPTQIEFYICLIIAGLLCILGGICSGLTVGYLSIDELTLELKLKSGTKEEKDAASKIMPIIKQHHVLLSTLLIANALALETLPIFLEASLPSFVAIILGTICVVIFAEILPQALCTGPRVLLINIRIAIGNR